MNTLPQWQSFEIPTRRGRTFREAAESYIEHGGDGRYLKPIIEHFDGKPLAEIFPFDINEMAKTLYPHHANATINRQAITPARAVIVHGYDRGWCNLIRIKSLKVERAKPRTPASQMWMHLFARQCEIDRLPHLAACVMFMSHTGARVSEAVELKWPQIDLQARTAMLLRTKTGRNSERFLTDELVARLYRLQQSACDDDLVFRYKSRWSVNDRIAAVCRRAELSYKPSHTCGRKAFATNAIAMGVDVRSTMDAGDWRSPNLFLNTYVFSRNAGRRVADIFNAKALDSAI